MLTRYHQGMFERLPKLIRHGGELITSKKRRQGSSPQSGGPRPSFANLNEVAAPRRASTYPDSIPHVKTAGQTRSFTPEQFGSLGLASTYPSHSMSNPMFDGVPDLTPTSSSDSLPSFGIAPIHDLQQNSTFGPTSLSSAFEDPAGLNIQIADISTMMFPSADPLAYPNQPMTAFENKHPQAFDRTIGTPGASSLSHPMSSSMDLKGQPAMFAPTSIPNGSGRHLNDSEAQLFGPMPMYLMQGAQQYRGYPPQPGMQMPGANMQFDEMMGQEDWAQSFMDPALTMNNGRPPHGGNQQFAQHGWR
jgi:hypothetical protein